MIFSKIIYIFEIVKHGYIIDKNLIKIELGGF